jgi:hypothetical protein
MFAGTVDGTCITVPYVRFLRCTVDTPSLSCHRDVITTMWAILDRDGPMVADEVYAQLFKDSEPDPTQAARALQNAVKKLIEYSDGVRNGCHSYTVASGFEEVSIHSRCSAEFTPLRQSVDL